jgi:photosystem II stability/assembly factor-like uncharacterized protein
MHQRVLVRISFAICLLLHFVTAGFSQLDIFALMQRRDLRLDSLQKMATRYFDSVGTGRGTGFKQYQRWLYEANFQVDENGFFRAPDHDWLAYSSFQEKDKEIIHGANPVGLAGTGPWKEKGPFDWNRTSGWNPGVGRLTAIAVHPVNPQIIYVSSPGGGIWKSIDGGGSWISLTDNHALWMNMYSVAIDPLQPETVYAGNNAGLIIKSSDGGASWLSVSTGITGIIRRIFIDPANPSVVLAAAGNGIWRSGNGGGSWQRTYVAANMEDIECKPGNGQILYASGSGLIRSTDGGLSWTVLGVPQGVVASGRTMLATCAADPEVVYAVQASGNEFGRLYYSNNSGQSFITVSTGSSGTCTNYFGYETTGCGSGGQAGYDMAIAVHPNQPMEVHIAGIIVFHSVDGGKTFTAQTAWSYPNSIGYNHADVHALEWAHDRLYSGTDGGIYVSSDHGENWTDKSGGLGIRQVYRVANSKQQAQQFNIGAQDNGSSVYANGQWMDWLGADGMDGIIHPDSTQVLFGTSQFGTLYRSYDGGQSYTSLQRPNSGEWITPLDFDETGKMLYGGWTGVFKSADHGQTWQKISGNAINTTVNCLAVAPGNPSYVYASKSNMLYVTKDGGLNWQSFILPASITDIFVSPKQPERIWLTCNSTFNRVFYSANAGSTLTNISDNLPTAAARSIAVAGDADETIYVGMNVGVFYRNNTTPGWVNITNNLPLVAINDLKIHEGGQLLRVGTFGRGVWDRPLIAMVSPICGAPTNLSVGTINHHSATVSWDAVSGAASYTVDVQLAGDTVWQVVASAVTGTSVSITGLNPGSQYNWRVATLCAGALRSGFVSGQFQSATLCLQASQLAVTQIQDSSATVVWRRSGPAHAVFIRPGNELSWTLLNGTYADTIIQVRSLLPGRQYTIGIVTLCEGGASDTSTLSFTTAQTPPCLHAFEPNDQMQSAAFIPTGMPVKSALGQPGDTDWFVIEVGNTSATHLRISLRELPANLRLRLYNQEMEWLASSDNEGLRDECILLRSDRSNRRYYIEVSADPSALPATGCYSLFAEQSIKPWLPQSGATLVIDEQWVVPASLYPNPASRLVNIKFESAREENGLLIISSSTGRRVKQLVFRIFRTFSRCLWPI